jgi:hypothetical protein
MTTIRTLATWTAGASLALGTLAVSTGPAAAASCDLGVSTPDKHTCEDTDDLIFGIDANPGHFGNELYVKVRAHWFLRNGTQDQYILGIEKAEVCVRDDQFARGEATLVVRQSNGVNAYLKTSTVGVRSGDWDPFDTCSSLIPAAQSGKLYFEVADPGGATKLAFLRASLQRLNPDSGSNIGSPKRKSMIPEGN